MSNMVQNVPDSGLQKDFLDLLRRYFREEVAGVCVPATVEAKQRDLKKFLAHYQSINGHMNLAEWLPRDTRSFIDALLKQDYMPATVNRALASVRSFGKWLRDHGVISADPSRGIRELQQEPLKPKAIRDLEFHRLRKAADVLVQSNTADYSQAFRDRALMEALNSSGLRISELLSLKLPQFVGKHFLNVRCKGGRYRNVLLTKEAAEVVAEYVRDHRIGGSDFVFTNRYGQGLSRNSASEAMNKIAGYANATLPQSEAIQVTCHKFRHRHGFKARAAKDDTFAQKRLGHASSRYVERYTTMSDDDEESILEHL